MIPFKKIDHILINVPIGKLEEAGEFYQNTLELPVVLGDRPFKALWFKIAEIELHITEEAPLGLSERHPAFEVTDLQATKTFLESKGIEISYSTKIEGRERLFFKDPFGNRFELIEFL
ncbi:VOC family protein [Pedobacter arcticus]|uniref:VOC family protein n=1 Tax=Pedobacter arcticus TaxID=752140 RepID=UPI00031E5901|nr:VOC family protein [Pedobacter arcticus]